MHRLSPLATAAVLAAAVLAPGGPAAHAKPAGPTPAAGSASPTAAPFAIPAPDPSRLAAPDGPLMRRGTLLVADLERSLAFWVGVLGFVVHSDTVSAPTSYAYPVFRIPRDARIRFVTLSDRREHRMMALEEVKGAALPPPADPRRVAMVIEVASVPETLARARALGLPIVEPVELRGAGGPVGLEAAIDDPDGHLVVIYDRSRMAPAR
jgi:catechol 2,3-dioxygenase-like lactoylglutathione lyase family enzyme